MTWLKTDDTKFRAAYFAKTNENIQDYPLESTDGLSYTVSSRRVTDTQMTELKADRGVFTKSTDLKTNDKWPTNFISTKESI